MKKCMILGLALLAGGVAQAAQIVEFETFNIRNNNGTTTSPWDGNLYVQENGEGDGFTASTPLSGQKVGYGTSSFDGFQLNDLNTVDWDKISGPANLTAYLNIWVTDGLGNYAVISSENDYRGTNFLTRTEWKIFEFGPSNSNFNWLFDSGTGGRNNQYLQRNGSNVTLADLSNNIVVFAGPVGPTTGVGTGAPRGGYGFNIIWGDTAANFTNGNPYTVDNVTVQWNGEDYQAGAVVPIPAAAGLGMLGMGLTGFMARLRKKKS